jgi:hypothetical protein
VTQGIIIDYMWNIKHFSVRISKNRPYDISVNRRRNRPFSEFLNKYIIIMSNTVLLSYYKK